MKKPETFYYLKRVLSDCWEQKSHEVKDEIIDQLLFKLMYTYSESGSLLL